MAKKAAAKKVSKSFEQTLWEVEQKYAEAAL